jgi:hypothetical protein
MPAEGADQISPCLFGRHLIQDRGSVTLRLFLLIG